MISKSLVATIDDIGKRYDLYSEPVRIFLRPDDEGQFEGMCVSIGFNKKVEPNTVLVEFGAIASFTINLTEFQQAQVPRSETKKEVI